MENSISFTNPQNQNKGLQTLTTINPSTVTVQDCLQANSIRSYPAELKPDIYTMVDEALALCAFSLGIDLDDNRRRLITEDVVDKYEYDSIQDVLLALKSIRQGEFKTFGKISMEIINEAMIKHREVVSDEREYKQTEQNRQTQGEAEFNKLFWLKMAQFKKDQRLEKMKEINVKANELIKSELEKKKTKMDQDKGNVE